jgi:hypothetical protein
MKPRHDSTTTGSHHSPHLGRGRLAVMAGGFLGSGLRFDTAASPRHGGFGLSNLLDDMRLLGGTRIRNLKSDEFHKTIRSQPLPRNHQTGD